MTTLQFVSLAVLAWALLVVLGWAVARWFLRGPDLVAFDHPTGPVFSKGALPSAEHQQVVASLGGVKKTLHGVPRRQHIAVLRKYLDEVFAPDVAPDVAPGASLPESPSKGAAAVTYTPVNAGGVDAEWVRTPGADPARRTLYIHGGAFAMGSAKSHRRLTREFARRTGGVVLAINYRLLPEHSRRAGFEDCQTAYRWLLDHGPGDVGRTGHEAPGSHPRDDAAVVSPSPATKLWVAGDSAGGNLTLALIAWVRDSGLRAPNAAVALSPATDATLGSPSMRLHVRSDPMLGPLFGPLGKVPQALLLWGAWLYTRINPRDPVVSPVYGDLSRLPPVLVQSSSAEMLRDDARRYVNRAVAAGSPVQLQTWDHMVHVWQIFHPELPEGRQALDEIEKFLAST